MVDPKSYELAEYFLAGFNGVNKVLIMSLAQAIQDAVEDWISDAKADDQISEGPITPEQASKDR